MSDATPRRQAGQRQIGGARFGVTLGDSTVPGPVTKALTDAFIALVDYDFVAQYTRHLS